MLNCTARTILVNGCQLPQVVSLSAVGMDQWRFRLVAHVDVYLNSGDSENAEFRDPGPKSQISGQGSYHWMAQPHGPL